VSAAIRVRAGLGRTRTSLAARFAALFARERTQDELRQGLEEALLGSDVGVRATEALLAVVDRIPTRERKAEQVQAVLRAEILKILGPPAEEPKALDAKPWVQLIVGVNGVGKTTTIGKLASRHGALGRRVLLVAGDTFRAAAIEQLTVWATRAGAQIVRQEFGGDPSAVVFDGIRAATARSADVVLIDTAGRLHTKSNLMDELKKVRRIIERESPGAPHEVLLVLDATTGQNALVQARAFSEAVQVTGLVLTKLDGTARGGVVIAVAAELGVPVKYIGVGEGVEDLQPFDPIAFTDALFSQTG
jgi:fused signal recognition particle receptor